MFCSKCGNQIPDGAAFCASCGTPAGGAPSKAGSQPQNLPPIISGLLTKTVGFFTGSRQVNVVADAANDKTWSGAILGAIGILVFALTQLLNMKSFIRGFLQLGGEAEYSAADKFAGRAMQYGYTFGFSLLYALVYAAVLVVMTYAVVKMCKKDIAFVSAVNVAAYASLPVIVICILNLLFGLAWGLLPAMLFVAAVAVSLALIYQALTKACALDSNAFAPFALMVLVVIVVTLCCGYGLFVGNLFN